MQQPTISDSFYTRQHEGKLLGLLEAQGEEIKELKELLNFQAKKIADLKSMIKSMAKDVLSTKDTSKKTESIASHLALLHSSTRQSASESNPNIERISSIPKSVASGPQIAPDLSQCEPKSIQKLFAEIGHIFYWFISGSQGTEGIELKSMNKDAKKSIATLYFFIHQKTKPGRESITNR